MRSEPVFIDSNVPMYLIGASHPNKDAAGRLLKDLIARDTLLVTDAEVFQEILHRYTAIQRMDAIPLAFDALRGLVDQVLPIGLEEVESAKRLLLETGALSARDALHASVMKLHGLRRILTFDADFDRIEWAERIAS